MNKQSKKYCKKLYELDTRSSKEIYKEKVAQKKLEQDEKRNQKNKVDKSHFFTQRVKRNSIKLTFSKIILMIVFGILAFFLCFGASTLINSILIS